MELILAGFLGAALLGLTQWVFIIRRDFTRELMQAKAELMEAMTEANMKIGGFKDHIAAQNVSIDCTEKALAEFTKNMDPGMLAQMQDRLALVEMATGVSRIQSKRQQ